MKDKNDTEILSSSSPGSLEKEKLPFGLSVIPMIELSYITHVKPSERPIIESSDLAYRLFYLCWDKKRIEMQEEFKVLLLNWSNKALGLYELSTGGVSKTIADPKLIFVAALKANASSIILAHNHPSGKLYPSRKDEISTLKIEQAGELLGIKLLDHIILSNEGYFSFAAEGLL